MHLVSIEMCDKMISKFGCKVYLYQFFWGGGGMLWAKRDDPFQTEQCLLCYPNTQSLKALKYDTILAHKCELKLIKTAYRFNVSVFKIKTKDWMSMSRYSTCMHAGILYCYSNLDIPLVSASAHFWSMWIIKTQHPNEMQLLQFKHFWNWSHD